MVRAAASGKRRKSQKSWAPRLRPRGRRGEPVSAKSGTGGVVGGGELVGAGMLVVEDRQDEGAFGVEERGGGGVGGGDDGLDVVAGVEGADAVEEEAPDAFGVGVRVGRAGKGAVRAGDVVDLAHRCGVDQRELGVGLADVDDEDAGGRGHSRWKTVSSGTATGRVVWIRLHDVGHVVPPAAHDRVAREVVHRVVVAAPEDAEERGRSRGRGGSSSRRRRLAAGARRARARWRRGGACTRPPGRG